MAAPRTRDRILEASLTLFNAEGLAAVSTHRIAAELGISPGNLHYHFKAKQLLVGVLFRRFEERLADNGSSLHSYAVSLREEMDDFWVQAGRPKAKGLLVVVGVKPGKKARVWSDAVDGEVSAETLAQFEKKLGEVPTIALQEGPIALTFEINLSGQADQHRDAFLRSR